MTVIFYYLTGGIAEFIRNYDAAVNMLIDCLFAQKQGNAFLGDIFGRMGIDLGNIGGLAESVLKTIGLAGKSI